MKIPGVSDEYFIVKSSGLSQFQAMSAYLGGSAFQTVCDNPVTAYRQLVQQYAKDAAGKPVDPKIATAEAKSIFKAHPVSASLSGVGPRLVGVGFKRVPKFGILLGISFFLGEGESPGTIAAFGASILSAPFINPIRMIEKQQVRTNTALCCHCSWSNVNGSVSQIVHCHNMLTHPFTSSCPLYNYSVRTFDKLATPSPLWRLSVNLPPRTFVLSFAEQSRSWDILLQVLFWD